MSYQGPRKPIIIPIPMSHLTNPNGDDLDTVIVGPPTILRISFSDIGWKFYRETILPYIWQGYNVKIRGQKTRQIPTTSPDIFQCYQCDFVTKGKNDDGINGNYGIYIGLPAKNTAVNTLYRFRDKMYTENGIDYSHYSYVIYP